VRIVAFGEDRDGELYFLDHDHGTVHTLERNDATAQNQTKSFPTTLSQTGLFTTIAEHTLAEGVVPFLINSRQWQDGATAEYWAAFPGRSFVTYYANGKPIPGLVYWHNFRMHFPKDAVLLKTLSLAGTRLETQLLHYDGADWRAYTFAWRNDQTDADLVPTDGLEKEFHIGDQRRVWQFQSRSQCMSCHSNQSEYALAFLPEQLNRIGPDGRNQLVALTEAQYLRRGDDGAAYLPPFDAVAAAQVPKVADPTDESLPLPTRARAYLHANCGHCHSDHGGGTVPLRLQHSIPLSRMQAIDVPPTRGALGLPGAAIIKPGDPYASTLYLRMAKFGRDRMPHIGSEWPDEDGLRLVEQWIASMDGDAQSLRSASGGSSGAAVGLSLSDPASALRAARRLGRGELTTPQRQTLLAAAAKLPAGPVRDLFEGYLPAGDPTQRKLGSNPRPSTILAVQGDAGRGEQLFWSEVVNCGKCHRIGQRGTPVGPDLATATQLRSKEDLLESLLWPSRRIEPKYAAYLVQMHDGRSLTGLLERRDRIAVVLRDGEGKQIELAADQIDHLHPLRTSLMPEGQTADLTAQQAADLLEYLRSLPRSVDEG
jgi:putative heme-binding domain-containing protein